MSSGGQIVGGALGAVAGFFLAGPLGVKAATAMMYGAQIGMMAGGYLDPPKGPTINGPRLSDLSVQTSTYGSVIPRVYGTVTVNGNVFWLENNTIKETVTKKKQGGKGGGAKSTTRTYTYSATFAVGLCKGPIAGVRRIWIGADLYYDAGSNDPATIQASNAAATGFEVYNGTDTQAADPRIQATLGVANTPAWRGLAYIVFSDLLLAKYGNSLAGAQVRVEVMQLGMTYTYPYQTFSMPSGQTWVKGTYDGTVYCTTANSTHIVAVSADGLSWQEHALPGTAPYRKGVASDGNGVLLCYGISSSGSIWRSVDHGVSWALVMFDWVWVLDIQWNGSYFLATTDSGSFYTSPTGLSWTAETPPSGTLFIDTPVWHEESNSWYVVGQAGSDPIVYTSPTAASGSWTTAYTMSGDLNNFTQGCVHKGRILFVGQGTGPSGSGPLMVWSDDGVTWTVTNVPIREYWMLSDGDNVWVGDGGGNGTCYYSPDGVDNWTYYDGPNLGLNHMAFYANFLLIAVPSGSGQGFRITKQISSPLPIVLGEIVSAECLESGLLTAADLDITALTQTVRGYRIGSLGSIRAALEPLQAAWPFDIVQAGYKIKFVARGGASVVTIPASDLDARSDGSAPGVQLTTVREMDSQLPRRVTVQYLDHAREYNTGVQYAERLNTSSVNSLTLELPIVLTATEAAGKAEVLLYMYWLERHDLLFNLPPTYNQLEPGDVVTLNMPEGTSSLRLVSVTNSSDGRVECQAKRAAAAIYTPAAIGVASAVTGPVTLTPVGASVYVLLDLPEISTAQNTPCFLAAMTGVLTGWDGGSLMQSTDSGSTWVDLHDFGAPGCTMGTASTVIGSVDSRVMDNGSVLTVVLSQGILSSVTQLALFGGANYFAYGVNGRWEIIAAMTCTLVSGSTYTLSNFLRGRFGTEQYMGTHVIGDSIVLLDTVDLALIVMGVGTIGLPYLYRGITYDRDIGTDGDRTFAYSAVNLKPLAPIYLTGNRDSSNNWELTWIRRTRDGGEWRDNVDAALGEASEAYQIDIYSDGTYATVKRTISVTSPTAAYTSADQTADFGSNQGTLYLKLYQISATVGRGYPLTTSITR